MGFLSKLFGGKLESEKEIDKIDHQIKQLDDELKKQTVIKTKASSVSPIGRTLSWNDNKDICFALGSFIVGLGASGSILIAENGKIIFNIGNFANAYNYINERVPSDVVDFFANNPSVLQRKQLNAGVVLKLQFEKSFNIKTPRTKENIQSSVDDTLEILSAEVQKGAKATNEILGKNVVLEIRVEGNDFSCSKTLWIK